MSFLKKFVRKKPKDNDKSCTDNNEQVIQQTHYVRNEASYKSPSAPVIQRLPSREEDNLEDLDFADILPADGKKARNLSISRSGRHKMKRRQRMSVVSDDTNEDIYPSHSFNSSSSAGERMKSSSSQNSSSRLTSTSSAGDDSAFGPDNEGGSTHAVTSNKNDSLGCRGSSNNSFQSAKNVFANRTATAL